MVRRLTARKRLLEEIKRKREKEEEEKSREKKVWKERWEQRRKELEYSKEELSRSLAEVQLLGEGESRVRPASPTSPRTTEEDVGEEGRWEVRVACWVGSDRGDRELEEDMASIAAVGGGLSGVGD